MSKILKLAEATATAEKLRAWCQNTLNMNVYQPLATSTVELCLAATPRLGLISNKNTRKKASSLAVHAVKRTATLIKNGADVPRSHEFLQGLERFETCGSYLLHFLHDPDLLPSALDMIRRHVESIPEQRTKPRKISFSALTFFRESARLKAELDRNHKTVLEMSKKPTMPSSTSRNECILEVTVLGNRKAALALADHAQNVTNLIVARTIALYGEADPENIHSLAPLCRALEQVQAFLQSLQNRRWRIAAWVLAGNEKDRFAELNSALDKALAVFA
ncbi:hypothetical protein B0H13DRAFT_2450856, partial [Mycena leptocephala]